MKVGLVVSLIYTVSGAACRNFEERPPPRLLVTPPALAFSGLAGGIGPPRQALTVDMIGVGALTWAAHGDVPWLALTPASDSAPAVAWVTALSAGLAPGSYTGTITITATSGSGQAVIPVTFMLASTVSLSGRWVGGDSATLALTLTQTDTVLGGTGTLHPPATSVSAAGFFRTPSVTLALRAPDSTVTMFTGSLVDENTVRGTLSGGRFASYAITLLRQ